MLADGIPISAPFPSPPTSPSTNPAPNPTVYQGQEQHFSGTADPYDREALWLSHYNTSSPLYKHIQSLNAIRSLALYKSATYLTSHTQVVYSDAHDVAFRKGDASYMTLMALSNRGEAAGAVSVSVKSSGFTPGLKVVDVLSCRSVVVDAAGGLVVGFVGGLPMVS